MPQELSAIDSAESNFCVLSAIAGEGHLLYSTDVRLHCKGLNFKPTNQKMRYFGLKVGLIFLVVSVVLTVTFVGPIFIVMFSEGLGSVLSDALNINHVGASTYYMSVFLCIMTLLIYLIALFKYKNHADGVLMILFVILIIFLNSAVFYYDFIQPGFHMDGQQAFNIIDKPAKTSWIYPLMGLYHDSIKKINEA